MGTIFNVDVIVAILGTSTIGSVISWFLSKRKYKTEVESNYIENMQKAMVFYQKACDDQTKRLEEQSVRLEEQSKQLLDVIENNNKLRQEINDLKTEINVLNTRLAKYEPKENPYCA